MKNEKYQHEDLSTREMEDLIEIIFNEELPQWKKYLIVNGPRMFLEYTETIHSFYDPILDLVFTYFKRDAYEMAVAGLKLSKKEKKYILKTGQKLPQREK